MELVNVVFFFFTDLTANGLLCVLLGNVASAVGSKVSVVCPEGQTVTIEVKCADDTYQLILCSCDLHILIAVRLALLNRLEVSPCTGYVFHTVYHAITRMITG